MLERQNAVSQRTNTKNGKKTQEIDKKRAVLMISMTSTTISILDWYNSEVFQSLWDPVFCAKSSSKSSQNGRGKCVEVVSAGTSDITVTNTFETSHLTVLRPLGNTKQLVHNSWIIFPPGKLQGQIRLVFLKNTTASIVVKAPFSGLQICFEVS